MSKDDASDLRSLQERVIQTALEHARATLVLANAKQDLENWIWRMEHPQA